MRLEKFGDFLFQAVSTVFFIGYLPLAPGTFGSLAAVGLFYLLFGIPKAIYFLFVWGVIVLGLITSGATEKLLNKKDPGCIVIDEVAGMLVALSFIPFDFKLIFLTFLIFRILDTLKPYPAGRLQNRHGAWGIMADDLVAGLYTSIVLQVIIILAF